MTSRQLKGISTARIAGPPGANIVDLECSVCHDVLWKPVACQTCEAPFCFACISQWLDGNSNCPNGCKVYIERKCPPFVARLLAKLQISCYFQPKGCQEVCSYEALDKHETECDYEPKQCSGCQSNIAKKELANHKRNCAALRAPRSDANIVYNRGGSGRKQSDNNSLRDQLRQLRQESEEYKNKIQLLTNQIVELQTRKKGGSQEITITFDDLPSAAGETKWIPEIYRGLKWTRIVYMDKSYAAETYPKSGYITAFLPGGSPHIAFFNEETSFSAENPNESFTLLSLSACAAWTENLHLTIKAYRNSIQVNTHTATLIFGKTQVIVLLWKNIDKIIFQPSGGSTIFDNDELERDTHCIITQLTIDR